LLIYKPKEQFVFLFLLYHTSDRHIYYALHVQVVLLFDGAFLYEDVLLVLINLFLHCILILRSLILQVLLPLFLLLLLCLYFFFHFLVNNFLTCLFLFQVFRSTIHKYSFCIFLSLTSSLNLPAAFDVFANTITPPYWPI